MKNKKIKLIITTFCLISFSCFSQEIENEDKLHTLLSSMTQKRDINEINNSAEKGIASFKLSTQTFAQGDVTQIENWHKNLLNMQKAAYDSIIKKYNLDNTVAKRIAASIVSNSVASWVTAQSSLAMHEAAHGKAALDIGATDIHYKSEIDGSSTSEKLTIGELYIKMITGQGSGGASTNYYLPANHTSEDRIQIAKAGLNSQVSFSEKQVEENWERGTTHFLDTIPYLLNKVSIYSYTQFVDPNIAENDLTSYISELANSGHIDEDQKDDVYNKLKNLSLFTALLSGGTWQGVISEINYVKTGNQTIPILGINTPAGFFTLPEFSTYLNQDNISLKGNFAFIPKDHFVKHLSLSLEKGVIGQCSQTEFGLSVSSSIGNFSGLTKIILGSDKKAGITQKINLKVGKNSYLFGEATYDTGTMDGQRKCYSASGDSCIQAEVGVEYRFNLR